MHIAPIRFVNLSLGRALPTPSPSARRLRRRPDGGQTGLLL